MQIIPVIDIRRGQVVMARGGQRDSYPLLQSCLTTATDAEKVITDLLHFYPFSTLYIADLDCISGLPLSSDYYQQLARQFPALTIWLDAGLSHPDQLGSRPAENLIWVAGTETMPCNKQISDHTDWVLSLDFRHKQLLGDPRWLQATEYWPEQVIVMDLDVVGRQQGPGFATLAMLQKYSTDTNLIASGGIRNISDLQQLQTSGIKSALVASALHQGKISPIQLSKLEMSD